MRFFVSGNVFCDLWLKERFCSEGECRRGTENYLLLAMELSVLRYEIAFTFKTHWELFKRLRK